MNVPPVTRDVDIACPLCGQTLTVTVVAWVDEHNRIATHNQPDDLVESHFQWHAGLLGKAALNRARRELIFDELFEGAE